MLIPVYITLGLLVNSLSHPRNRLAPAETKNDDNIKIESNSLIDQPGNQFKTEPSKCLSRNMLNSFGRNHKINRKAMFTKNNKKRGITIFLRFI